MAAARSRIDPVLILKERAEARAILLEAGEFSTYQDAAMPLIGYAQRSGIPAKLAVKIIDEAFNVRRPVPLSGMENADRGNE